MERLKRVIELLPEFVSAGLLDASGGNLAVRTSKGVYVTPSQAGEELRWRLSPDDFVLFPGSGEASMARAGRRPSRDNHMHRAVFTAQPGWNCSYFGHPWGLLGYALAGKPLHLSAAHSRIINRHHAINIPVIPDMTAAPIELAEQCSILVQQSYHDCEYGAVILEGYGVMVAGAEPEPVLALALTLEKCAKAQR